MFAYDYSVVNTYIHDLSEMQRGKRVPGSRERPARVVAGVCLSCHCRQPAVNFAQILGERSVGAWQVAEAQGAQRQPCMFSSQNPVSQGQDGAYLGLFTELET